MVALGELLAEPGCGMNVVPEMSDPRWRELVAGPRATPLASLAVRMLVTRLRLKTYRGDEPSIQEAIGIAHEFFVRNPASTQADVRSIFGETE
jgi:hypothetical protein